MKISTDARIDMKNLKDKLEEYESRGIPLYMEGNPATPAEILFHHKIREEGFYMPDYILDEKGNVMELRYDLIREI